MVGPHCIVANMPHDQCAAGRIWQWAGARALTSEFVISKMRLEIVRKAAEAAAAAAADLVKATARAGKKRDKLAGSWQLAAAVWRASPVADGSTYQEYLDGLPTLSLRKVSSYVYRHLFHKDDAKELGFKRGTPPAEVRVKVLAFVLANLLLPAAPRPMFKCADEMLGAAGVACVRFQDSHGSSSKNNNTLQSRFLWYFLGGGTCTCTYISLGRSCGRPMTRRPMTLMAGGC